MFRTSHKRALMTSSALVATVLALPALAQTAAPAAPRTAVPAQLTEVTVTATRVRTDAQKTPIALTVYSAARLQAQGVHNLQALQNIDPSINITTSNGAAYIAVRGVESTDVTEIGDPAVPVARDDFFTNRSYEIASSLYDVQRIEILKGPQGTLNGRASTGGQINIVTNKPNFDKFGGYVNVEVGSFDTINTEAAVNVPVNDKIAFRFAGLQQYHEGYTPMANGQRGNDSRGQSGRAQVALKPIEGLAINASYQNDHVNDVGDVSFNGPLGVVQHFNSPNGEVTSYVPQYNILHGHRIQWNASYDRLPMGLTLTYQGGIDHEQWNHQLDATNFNNFPATRSFTQYEDPITWNHEVRLANDPSSRWTFQGGWFHFSEDNNLNSAEIDQANELGFTGADFNHVTGIDFIYNVRTQSNGYFGQSSYKINDQFKVTGGIRYDEDQKVRTGEANLYFPGLVYPWYAPFTNAVTPGNGETHDNRTIFLANIDYTPTPNNLIYVKYATGYKPGGFNSNGSAPSINYDPETLASYEIGSKNWFLGHTLQLNADAFYESYNGYQASQTTSVLSGGGVFNVGSARIYGAELQGIWLVQNIGRFDVNATFLNSRFGNGIYVADGASTPQTFDIGGNELPNAAPATITAGYERDFILPNGTLTPRIDMKYSSAFYFDVFNNADTRSPATTSANLTVSYAPDVGNWKLSAYVRNLTNAVIWTNAAQNFNANQDTFEFAPPRTFGAQVNYKF